MPAFAGMTAECRRASSPRVHSGPRVRRSFLSLISPWGACGTLGVSPRPRRRVCRHAIGTPGALHLSAQGSRCSKEQRRGHLQFTPLEGSPPRKQVLRLRSARGWTLRLAACPQELPLLWTRRLVRTDCRPDMHLDRPPDPASRFKRFAGHARRRLSPLSRGSRTFHP